jgi:hypothetical protein
VLLGSPASYSLSGGMRRLNRAGFAGGSSS